MSKGINIKERVDALIERLWARTGKGMSLLPGGLLTCHPDSGSEQSATTPWPRAGTPDVLNGRFVFNLVPIRGIEVDPRESVALQNAKAYVMLLATPVAYSDGGGPPLYGVGYANVDSMTLITVPHGATPTRVNATVNSLTGAVTQGTYYFYCGKLFSNGTVQGVASADGSDDVEFFYPNITSFGWMPPPDAGIHYPPIDLL